MAISPEGTRKKVSKWKTGFYYIAKRANVPVVCISLNFYERTVTFSKPYELTNNKDLDFKNLKKILLDQWENQRIIMNFQCYDKHFVHHHHPHTFLKACLYHFLILIQVFIIVSNPFKSRVDYYYIPFF